MDDQTSQQTSPGPIRGRPFQLGPDHRRGRGPAKGAANAGRPPDEFKRLMASLASREQTIRALAHILENPSHPHFLGALKFVAERGYGLPLQTIDVDSQQRFVIEVPAKVTVAEWTELHRLRKV